MLNPLLLGLAATATLLVLAVAVIVVALCRKHFTGRPGSPKHAPIVCEPPNAGATTPVHPQTKQAVDDIDPDIIPNEYGEYADVPIVAKRVARIAPCTAHHVRRLALLRVDENLAGSSHARIFLAYVTRRRVIQRQNYIKTIFTFPRYIYEDTECGRFYFFLNTGGDAR